MSRTKIKITRCVFNAGFVKPTATTFDQSNGMYLAVADMENETFPATRGAENLILEVLNTDSSDHALIIRAGVNPPAQRKDLGDLSVTITHSATVPFLVGPLETARFLQADGTINVDGATSFAGTIQGYLLDKALIQ
jgi:hypothetical protein